MRYEVRCPACPAHINPSVFPDRDGAEAYVRRHHIVGDKHRADITRVLDTPFEGLVYR